MYLFIALLILYHGDKCFGESVLLAKVLEDGFIYSTLKPLKIDIEPPSDIQEQTDVTICFWLYPFRVYWSNSLFSINFNDMLYEISLTLMEEDFLISSTDCYFYLDIKPEFRKWTSFCLVLSSSFEVYINGFHKFSGNCSLSEILQGSKNIDITIGRNSQTKVPYSGMIADFRFYYSKLSRMKIKSISKINTTSTDYQNVLNVSTSTRSFVVIDTINSTELLKTPQSFVLLFITGISTHENAEKVCKVRRGLLPDLDAHGELTLVDLIVTFQEKTDKIFTTFWLNKKNSSCHKGTFDVKSLKIRRSIEPCNFSRNNYFCVVNKNVKYHLIGFHRDDPEFFPVPNVIGVFDSNSKYKLYFENDMFILKDLSENYILYECERIKIGKLVGRHLWHKPNSYNNSKEMTFSGCNFNEFTCSNGECIDAHHLCQYLGECSDNSDEAFSICKVGIDPTTFYDKTIPPNPDSTNVTINFKLLRMAEINMEDSMMNLYFLCTLSWKDERLGFKFLKPNVSNSLAKETAEKYWKPLVIMKEASNNSESALSFEDSIFSVMASENLNGIFGVIDSYRAKYYLGKDVVIKSETYINISIDCDMNLFFYPFDAQACSFTLQLDKNDQMTNIIWDKKTSKVSFEFVLSIYEIEDFEYSFVEPDELQLTWILSRKYGAYMLSVILPCVGCGLVTVASLLFPTDETFNRVYSSFSALTVIVNLFALLTDTMPKSDEPKLIDIWMFIHMLVGIIVFVANIAVILVARAERDKGHDKITFSFGLIFFKKRRNKLREKLSKIKKFRSRRTHPSNEDETSSVNSEKLNRNFLILSLFAYCLFLFFFLLAAGRYIDPLLGV